MVGVVTASVGDPFWTGVLQGVEAVIGGGDRFILSASTRDRSDREPEIVAAMVERRVMALLVVPTAFDQSYLGAIVAGGTPVVCLDRPAVGADIDAVVADDVGGVRRGMDLLIDRGHRRIAFLGTGSIYTTGKRVEGYRQALAAAGIAYDDALVHAAINEPALVDPAVDSMLALDDPPTAVFVANVNTSVGLLVRSAPATVGAGHRRLQRLRRGAHPRPDGHGRRQRSGRARPARRRAGARAARRLSRSGPTGAHRHADHRAREPPGRPADDTAADHPLPPNVIEHFYRGGERIAALRGDRRGGRQPAAPMRRPEEWLASTVTRWGTDGVGAHRPRRRSGRWTELIAADPDGWLGPAHVARWGASPALLVKLLDAGQRLPVHAHPTARSPPTTSAARSARPRRGSCSTCRPAAAPCSSGRPGRSAARSGPSSSTPRRRTRCSTCSTRSPCNPGDGVLVPASTPHCIDAGVFIVELQEPTDFSVLLEWDGFDLDGPADGHLGLGFDVALDAVRTDAFDGADVDRLVRRADATDAPGAPGRCCPTLADPYFRAWGVDAPTRRGHRSGGVLGRRRHRREGTLSGPAAASTISRGDAFVVPHAAGAADVRRRRHGHRRPATGPGRARTRRVGRGHERRL